MTTSHRTVLAALVAVAALLGLAACGDTPAPDTAATPGPLPEPQPIDPDERRAPSDASYLMALDALGVPYGTDADAIAAGQEVCNFLDAEVPIVGLDSAVTSAGLITIQAGGYEPRQAGHIIGAAIGAYCPEYSEGVGA